MCGAVAQVRCGGVRTGIQQDAASSLHTSLGANRPQPAPWALPSAAHTQSSVGYPKQNVFSGLP